MCKNRVILFLNIDFGIFFLNEYLRQIFHGPLSRLLQGGVKFFQLGHMIYLSKSYPTWF
jgi:hypothetical protein